MADGTSPVRTIHSASDESAEKAESSKAHTIRSASEEAAEKTGSSKIHTIRSASDEGATRSGGTVARKPHDDRSARPSGRVAAQSARDFVQQATRWPAPQSGTGGELAGRTVQGATREAEQNLTMAMEFGNVMASSYGAACSEMVKHMNRAAQRQSEMMNDMLRARSPSDVLIAGNRFWLDGMLAFFDTSTRIVQASARAADAAGQKRIGRAG